MADVSLAQTVWKLWCSQSRATSNESKALGSNCLLAVLSQFFLLGDVLHCFFVCVLAGLQIYNLVEPFHAVSSHVSFSAASEPQYKTSSSFFKFPRLYVAGAHVWTMQFLPVLEKSWRATLVALDPWEFGASTATRFKRTHLWRFCVFCWKRSWGMRRL